VRTFTSFEYHPNKFKTKVLEEKLRKELKGAKLITHQYKVDTGVEQPYDEMGEVCLLERIEATLRYAETNVPLLEENNIGTVVIGGIENYIRVSDSNDQTSQQASQVKPTGQLGLSLIWC
jgi:hypothetical protein